MRRDAESPVRGVLLFFLSFLLPAGARAVDLQSVEVKAGDTLWSIAQRALQDPQRWDELLRYNRQLQADPTVALPGMTLRVPVVLLKPALRAAVLTYLEGKASRRPAAGGDWVEVRAGATLEPGDLLRTEDWSRARIKFPHGSVLNLDSRSIVQIKPPADGGPDLDLVQGTLRALDLHLKAGGSAIAPRETNTIYEVTAAHEGPVKVQVMAGAADVSAAQSAVRVAAGFEVDVPAGGAPAVPKSSDPVKAVAARPAAVGGGPATDLGALQVDLESIQTGVPLSGFRIQLSRSADFGEIVLDKMFEPDERISLKQAAGRSGVYWWRAAPVDLLGQTGKFSPPKRTVIQ